MGAVGVCDDLVSNEHQWCQVHSCGVVILAAHNEHICETWKQCWTSSRWIGIVCVDYACTDMRRKHCPDRRQDIFVPLTQQKHKWERANNWETVRWWEEDKGGKFDLHEGYY